MRKFVQGFKNIRMRWKVVPFLILGVITGFVVWAKRPQYEIKRTNVTQEGEWLRIEFDITNLTSHEATVWTHPDTGQVDVALVFSDSIPSYWDTIESVQFSKFPVEFIDYKDGTIPAGQTKKGVVFIHSALGECSFCGITYIFKLPDESFHRVMESTLNRLEWFLHDYGINMKFFKKQIISFFSPSKLPITDPFVPKELISETKGPTLLDEITNFVNQEIPPSAEFVRKNDAYITMKAIAASKGASFEWIGDPSLNAKWEDELLWRTGIGFAAVADEEDKERAREAERDFNAQPEEVIIRALRYLKELERLVPEVKLRDYFETYERRIEETHTKKEK